MTNVTIVEALSQVAREKNVDRDMVVQTLADALVSAAKKRYGNTENYEADIDSTTGRMGVIARKTVVDEVVEPSLEIDLEDARAIDAKAEVGAVIEEQLDFADFGRNAIQTAKQILIQRVREVERERIYNEFSGRVGQIESGTVQQISRGDIVLNMGRAEAAIPLREQIRRERYRQGDTVRGLIYEILQSTRGPQVLLSRTHPDLLKKLFSIEVPEIAEGIVEIHAVARDPGERAKIAVSSRDERVDPVGACVGVKGSRVQAIVRELSGERIDIVPWVDEPEIFIGRALSPAQVSRVVLDHRRHHATVIVLEDQLSLAIGKSGQNSRLAVQLTGWGLDIVSEGDYQKNRARLDESKQELRLLPGVSELIALSLATSGFTSIQSIAESGKEMLQTVPGIDTPERAAELMQAAQEVVEAEAELAAAGGTPTLEAAIPAVEAEPESQPDDTATTASEAVVVDVAEIVAGSVPEEAQTEAEAEAEAANPNADGQLPADPNEPAAS
ncbi:MAG: transcription termination factor NusA [Candidatus Latescibacteria bacterium]|nr:transcription termination factor NusA [Candidatus Latescibacterota bacterium]